MASDSSKAAAIKPPEMKCVDGNWAVAHASYRMNDCAYIFPITPSSPMVSGMYWMATRIVYYLVINLIYKLITRNRSIGLTTCLFLTGRRGG
jgi:hypothetical protein